MLRKKKKISINKLLKMLKNWHKITQLNFNNKEMFIEKFY